MKFIVDCATSLGTGLAVGVLFAFMRLPIPAPPVVPAVMGILGITLGYMIKTKIFG